jgi:hypothetical protein
MYAEVTSPSTGCRIKVKLTLEQAMKAFKGNRGIVLLILNLGARGR